MNIFKLPDLGEGLPEAEIVEWFVNEGDQVEIDQNLVAVETAKALVDIPSPQNGQITRLYGKVGDIIHTGDPLLEFAVNDQQQTDETNTANMEKSESVSVVGEIPSGGPKVQESLQETIAPVAHKGVSIKVTPAVRALAHRLDIDLSIVTPTGPNDTITAHDIERVAKILQDVGQLIPLKGVRRSMAIAMEKAHAEVVPVTITEDADIQCWSANEDFSLRLIRAMCKACQAEPALNAWYDGHSIGRRLIEKIHLGIAVDTRDGLFVPVIRDVASLSPTALRERIDQLKIALSERKVPPDEMRGYTITLSNFGNIGGRYASPVVMPPSVAILGAGKCRKQVVMEADQVAFHRTLPLSLSFDHRAVTGGEAGRFLMAVVNDLQLAE